MKNFMIGRGGWGIIKEAPVEREKGGGITRLLRRGE